MEKLKNGFQKIEEFFGKIQLIKWITLLCLILWIILLCIWIIKYYYFGSDIDIEVLSYRFLIIWASLISFYLFCILWKEKNKNHLLKILILFIVLSLLLILTKVFFLGNYTPNFYLTLFYEIFSIPVDNIPTRFLFYCLQIFIPVFSLIFIYRNTTKENKIFVHYVWFSLILCSFLIKFFWQTPLSGFWNNLYNTDSLVGILYNIRESILNVIFFIFIFLFLYEYNIIRNLFTSLYKFIKFLFFKSYDVIKNLYINIKHYFSSRSKSSRENVFRIKWKFILIIILLWLLACIYNTYNEYLIDYYWDYYSFDHAESDIKKFTSNRELYYLSDSWLEYQWPISYAWCVYLHSNQLRNKVTSKNYLCKQSNCLKKILSNWEKDCRVYKIDDVLENDS